jgi:hypothetical protein
MEVDADTALTTIRLDTVKMTMSSRVACLLTLFPTIISLFL